MFSSNPFQQQLPSSIHVFPPSNSFFDLEKDGVHFNHHHHHHHHNHQFAPPPASVTGQQQQLSKESGFHYCDDNSNLLDSVIYPSKRKMSNMKKDGHSKIHTAQGPRDRRVRLSIEVARKFFYLQDLLGFDKASKTLDWLFTKSKNSIKELVEEMKLHCSFSDANDQCEVFQDTVKRGLVEEEDKGLQKKSATSKYFEGRKKLKMTRKNKSGVDVNQSRAEARARARERTKEKMQNKKLDVESKKALDDSYRVINPSNVTFQTSFWSQNESVMEQKVSSSLLYGYQHNHQLLVSSDLSSEIRTRPEREINHWVVNSDLSAATRFGNPRPPRSNLFDEAS